MLVRFTKEGPAAEADRLFCARPDGSATEAPMRRQGILPHEAFHFVVEKTLGWHDAFFGQIAAGKSIDETTALLHRTDGSWRKLTQAIQAEALIECLQAEQWGGASDPATFAEKLVQTCRRLGALPPDITSEEIERVRMTLREFGAAWRPLTAGQSLERTF